MSGEKDVIYFFVVTSRFSLLVRGVLGNDGMLISNAWPCEYGNIGIDRRLLATANTILERVFLAPGPRVLVAVSPVLIAEVLSEEIGSTSRCMMKHQRV